MPLRHSDMPIHASQAAASAVASQPGIAEHGLQPSRADAVQQAVNAFDCGDFQRDLARRVAWRTESQNPEQAALLRGYLAEELTPSLALLGCASTVYDNPVAGAPPLLIAEHQEDTSLPTALLYGHGDVVNGQAERWAEGRDPWTLDAVGERLYGRGTADNKGQHSINLAALAAVRRARGGRFGFNFKYLFEMGEETGSPGLRSFCASQADRLRADVLIASDGPRLHADQPTVFLGSRGVANFDLVLRLRNSAYHSGNWGGLLRNPGTVLANAIATLVDGRGRLLVPNLRPPPIPAPVRRALAAVVPGGEPADPAIDADWGEPGLTNAERVFAWNTLEVLAFGCGDPAQPVNAIPHEARAALQLRFVVGTDWPNLRAHLRQHLTAHGYGDVVVGEPVTMTATRLEPENPWVHFALASIGRTTGRTPVLLPNIGGSLPNDAFADALGLPTVWVPHSHPSCSQHAPDEHLLAPTAREALGLMAGLFWDLGEQAATLPRHRPQS